MKIKTIFVIFLLLLSGCFPVATDTKIGQELNWATSKSMPIYLSFSRSKGIPFHFLLSKHSNKDFYRLFVRWKNKKPGQLLFDGYDTTLKFMVNEYEIFKLNPISLPKKISFTIDKLHTEETEFKLTKAQFKSLAYAKDVKVSLSGKRIEVTGRFNRKDTFKAFREFDEESY